MTIQLPDPATEDCRAISSILARVGDNGPCSSSYCSAMARSALMRSGGWSAVFTEDAHVHAAWIRARRPGDADCLPHHSAACGLRIDQARQHLVGGRGTAQFVGARSCERDPYIAATVRREGRRLTPTPDALLRRSEPEVRASGRDVA
jgi:hypothetical protein